MWPQVTVTLFHPVCNISLARFARNFEGLWALGNFMADPCFKASGIVNTVSQLSRLNSEKILMSRDTETFIVTGVQHCLCATRWRHQGMLKLKIWSKLWYFALKGHTVNQSKWDLAWKSTKCDPGWRMVWYMRPQNSKFVKLRFFAQWRQLYTDQLGIKLWNLLVYVCHQD